MEGHAFKKLVVNKFSLYTFVNSNESWHILLRPTRLKTAIKEALWTISFGDCRYWYEIAINEYGEAIHST